MDQNETIRVFKTVVESGCCKRCILRYLGKGSDLLKSFNDPETCLKSTILCESNEDLSQLLSTIENNNNIKPCVVCLNSLHDSVLNNIISTVELQKLMENYDCTSFVNYISFPSAILIREHSMEMYLKQSFPSFFNDDHFIIPINKAWSLSIQSRLEQVAHKKMDRNSSLIVQINLTYELDVQECSVVYKLQDSHLKQRKLSKNIINENLKNVNDDIFRKHVQIPPVKSEKSVYLDSITLSHESIFLAGRYCKYSRNLGQTPWVLDNVKIVETCVQDIIFEPLEKLLNCKSLVFSASGREDFDVRMLGRGRPFFIKICDPKITKLNFEQLRCVEKFIAASKQISVRDLQFIDKKLLSYIKEGEETKKKSYRALCIIDKPEKLQEYINKINNIGSNIVLEQKTPVRVFHRRSSGIRKKEIFHIEARSLANINNMFELDVVTQAGTYIKEFVHGDLGRTRPSLGNIIGGFVDILTLDVMDIHLDFPPPIIVQSDKTLDV